MLGFFLNHQPEAYALGGLTSLFCSGVKEVAEERVGVDLAFQEAAPWHDGVGIVTTAAAVLHGVLEQGFHVGSEGLLNLAAEGDAPGLGERLAVRVLQEQLEGAEAAGLAEDIGIEATLAGGYEVVLGLLLELAERLAGAGLEGHGREERAGEEVVLERNRTAPPGTSLHAEVAAVQILDRSLNVYGGEVGVRHRGYALEYSGRDERR